MQNNSFGNSLARPWRWLLGHGVGFWHDNTIRRFRFVKGQWSWSDEVGKRACFLTVFSRNHYREFIHSYPIASASELRKVLQTEFEASPYVLHVIGPEQEQQRKVCSFVFEPQAVEAAAGARLLVPESLLAWLAGRGKGPIKHFQGQAEFFLNCNDVIPVSLKAMALCRTPQDFALSVGLPLPAQAQVVPAQLRPAELMSAMPAWFAQCWRYSLFKRSVRTWRSLPLKGMAITLLAVSLLYAGVIEGYYRWSISAAESGLAELGPEVSDLLDGRQRQQQNADSYLQLYQAKRHQVRMAQLWLVLLPLLEQNELGVQVQNIGHSGERTVIRGMGNRATDVLTAIQASEYVSDAMFDAPVRRDKEKDVFVIGLTLKQVKREPGNAAE